MRISDWSSDVCSSDLTNISAYISKFKNLQTQAAGLPPNADGDGDNTNDPTNTALIVNAGSAKTKGVELDGFVRYEGFQFNYGLALFDGDIDLQPQAGLEGLLTTTHKFDRAPEASFTLGGHYEYPDPVLGGSLNFDLNYYWTDNYIVGLARFYSYNLLNGHIAINNIMAYGLDVQIFGQNLTDKTYFLNPKA